MDNQYPVEAQQYPFDVEYQKSLLRMLCEDSRFSHMVGEHLQPQYFENEVLSWAWSFAIRFRHKYGVYPNIQTVMQQTRVMDPKVRPIYEVTLEQVRHAIPRDELWMKDQVLEFVKRNIFVRTFSECRSLFNAGKVTQTYDLMMTRMEKLYQTKWATVDESWFFEDLPNRQTRRLTSDSTDRAVATGLHVLDHILGGGLSKGELGLWVAYPKIGKSSMLVSHGVAATRLQLRRTAHFVLEGSRKQVEDRYEAAFTGEIYRALRTDGLSSKAYSDAYERYQQYKGTLYIRGFCEEWNYTCADIHEALKDLKRVHSWDPDLIIVDYGDLLCGRDKHYANDRENQKAAFRDLKSLANRGYAVWSASQAQRPEKGAEDNAHWLYSRQIADCYEKVRVADFIGSLNITTLEKDAKVMRLLAELYRDNMAGDKWVVSCDFSTMAIKSDPNAKSPSMPEILADPGIGKFVSKHQIQAPLPQQAQPIIPKPIQMQAPLR